MHVHLSIVNDKMWSVIEDGPIQNLKINTTGNEDYVQKPKAEWTIEDKKGQSR